MKWNNIIASSAVLAWLHGLAAALLGTLGLAAALLGTLGLANFALFGWVAAGVFAAVFAVGLIGRAFDLSESEMAERNWEFRRGTTEALDLLHKRVKALEQERKKPASETCD
jgi:hypothetical protein